MRGRLALGVVTILALLLGFSNLGLNQAPRSAFAQGVPPTFTPTSTPITGTSTPTSTATGTSPPTATGTATGVPPGPTNTPGAQPTSGGAPRPPGPPATPSLGIKIDACARVVGPQGLSLGDAPGFSANHVQIVGRDDVVFVTDGPQRADGLWWWKVTTREGVVGWGINDHLLPYGGECFGIAAAATTISTSPTPLPASVAGSQAQLPATGAGNDGLIFAGLLVVVLLVAGLVRRRSQGTV